MLLPANYLINFFFNFSFQGDTGLLHIRKAIENKNDCLLRDVRARLTKGVPKQFPGSYNLQLDELAASLVPQDIDDDNRCFAAKTTGDGNCLYNAVSITLKGMWTNFYTMYSSNQLFPEQ